MSFSPDGKRIAYLRNLVEGDTQLRVANADGSGDQVLAEGKEIVKGSLGLDSDPFWASSQDLICITAYKERLHGSGQPIFVALTSDRKIVRNFDLPPTMEPRSFAWLPDRSGLYFAAQEQGDLRSQLWFLPYPAGDPLRVTNDLDSYYSVSLSADGKSLVTIQRRRESTIYWGESPELVTDHINWKLHAISSNRVSGGSLAWTADGNILQSDQLGQSYLAASDGTSQNRLLDTDDAFTDPSPCGTGDIVTLMKRTQDGRSIWLLNRATKELKQLTFGFFDQLPDCSPDGKTVTFVAFDPKVSLFFISTLPIEGGTPKVLSPRFSPDGNSIGYLKLAGQGQNTVSTFVIQRISDASVREIAAPPGASASRWTPDGQGIAFLRTENNSVDLYVQPLSGAAPLRIMHFDEEPSEISAYAWSRDGKKIAVTRSRFNDSDVVLFTGLH